jgi:acetylornithine deacetylase/succinyl-diaminopimelate desuccinylase-like protein
VNPHEAIDRDFDAHLERIRDFLRIPSVSAHGGDLRSTADAMCELIDLAGGTAAPREPGEKRPTVIGVIEGPGPTVLRYGMYDVQPTTVLPHTSAPLAMPTASANGKLNGQITGNTPYGRMTDTLSSRSDRRPSGTRSPSLSSMNVQ